MKRILKEWHLPGLGFGVLVVILWNQAALQPGDLYAREKMAAAQSLSAGLPGDQTKGNVPASGSCSVAAASETDSTEEGNAAFGRALFLGSLRFDSGGPPCASCHTAGNFRSLGSRILASDLSGIFENLGGAEGIRDVLENPDFPVMSAAYRGKPFTEQEKRDLIAFFTALNQAAAAEQPPGSPFGRLELFGAVAGGVLFLLLIFFRPRRRDMFEILRRKS